MPALFDFSACWRDLVGKRYDLGYKNLSAHERVWFNVQSLIQAIDDGGLVSYYYNSGADDLVDCMASLSQLGDASMQSLLRQVNTLFPHGVPTDQDARNVVIGSWLERDSSVDAFLDPIQEAAS